MTEKPNSHMCFYNGCRAVKHVQNMLSDYSLKEYMLHQKHITIKKELAVDISGKLNQTKAGLFSRSVGPCMIALKYLVVVYWLL